MGRKSKWPGRQRKDQWRGCRDGETSVRMSGQSASPRPPLPSTNFTSSFLSPLLPVRKQESLGSNRSISLVTSPTLVLIYLQNCLLLKRLLYRPPMDALETHSGQQLRPYTLNYPVQSLTEGIRLEIRLQDPMWNLKRSHSTWPRSWMLCAERSVNSFSSLTPNKHRYLSPYKDLRGRFSVVQLPLMNKIICTPVRH